MLYSPYDEDIRNSQLITLNINPHSSIRVELYISKKSLEEEGIIAKEILTSSKPLLINCSQIDIILTD